MIDCSQFRCAANLYEPVATLEHRFHLADLLIAHFLIPGQSHGIAVNLIMRQSEFKDAGELPCGSELEYG
jgi:hypothetical protein